MYKNKKKTATYLLPSIILAPTIDIKGVVTGSEVVEFAGSLDNFFNPGIAKFNHIAGIHVDQVIVLHTVIGLFKLGDVLAKLMFYHKAAVQQ